LPSNPPAQILQPRSGPKAFGGSDRNSSRYCILKLAIGIVGSFASSALTSYRFGRKIAWLPSYNFSEAPPSIDCLDPWHIRPSPGCPNNGSPDDRKALTDLLARVTAR
jgi:hypothetical protein